MTCHTGYHVTLAALLVTVCGVLQWFILAVEGQGQIILTVVLCYWLIILDCTFDTKLKHLISTISFCISKFSVAVSYTCIS